MKITGVGHFSTVLKREKRGDKRVRHRQQRSSYMDVRMVSMHRLTWYDGCQFRWCSSSLASYGSIFHVFLGANRFKLRLSTRASLGRAQDHLSFEDRVSLSMSVYDASSDVGGLKLKNDKSFADGSPVRTSLYIIQHSGKKIWKGLTHTAFSLHCLGVRILFSKIGQITSRCT